MRTLLRSGSVARASGKTILAGEHAVVYGHKAVAAALPGLGLTLRAGEPEPGLAWESCWFDAMGEPLGEAERSALLVLWQRALGLVAPGRTLSEFTPQRITLESNLPRGAGLGSSAALSVATLRLLADWRAGAAPTLEEANALDMIFHGRASGLDVATVLSGGVVEYQRGQPPHPLEAKAPFWLVLLDTGTRASTRVQVERVARLRQEDPVGVDALLSRMGQAALEVSQGLLRAEFARVGQAFDEAHAALVALGLSCSELDSAVGWLRERRALGAKLTGSGGGGVAIGIFESDPKDRVDLGENETTVLVARVPGRGDWNGS